VLFTPDNIIIESAQGFIVLEGPNGAGKSTVAQALKAYAESLGHKVILTFEPGNTAVGTEIRKIVLGQTSEESRLTHLAELLLFSADRNLHVEKLIKPALARQEIVICDRYFYSTMAFQGYGRGLDLAQIEFFSDLATTGLTPDAVILLDLPVEVGLQRTASRKSLDQDSFESEKIEFHQRLRDGFLKIAKDRPEPFVVINAAEQIDQVCAAAIKVLEAVLKSK
jgi:dTMP kinase